MATGVLSHRHPQEPGDAADGGDAQGRRHPQPRRLVRGAEAAAPDGAAKADDALVAAGRKVAQGNRCTSCHKDDFSGTQATARLAAQREDYLLKALRDFKAGKRVGGGVAAMADVVYPLGDDDLRALAHFLAHLPS